MLALALLAGAPARAADPPAVVELFGEEADDFIAQLTNDGGADPSASAATREEADRFAGPFALRVTPQQRFRSLIKGWNYAIRDKPAPGEYRFLRLAWKKVGGSGIMVQLCDNGNWEHRYVGGTNAVGWPALSVAAKSPEKWEVVTRDLFKDFNAFTLTGMAFTPMDGTAGLFDHVCLGRSVADLDKVTDAVLGKTALKGELKKADLERLWQDLASADAAVYAPAAAALTAGKKEAMPFLRELLKPGAAPDEKELLKWIAELDHEEYRVREKAEEELGKRGAAAEELLKKALRSTDSAEARLRIERLLSKRKGAEVATTPEQLRLRRTVRVLESANTPEAIQALEGLVKNAPSERLRQEARKAVARLEKKAAPAKP
jgi:hypothetical protein